MSYFCNQIFAYPHQYGCLIGHPLIDDRSVLPSYGTLSYLDRFPSSKVMKSILQITTSITRLIRFNRKVSSDQLANFNRET